MLESTWAGAGAGAGASSAWLGGDVKITSQNVCKFQFIYKTSCPAIAAFHDKYVELVVVGVAWTSIAYVYCLSG